MYPDSGYKMTHAQSVCTRPFSRGEGPGDEAKSEPTLIRYTPVMKPLLVGHILL